MSDRTEFLHPDYEPGEFDRVERELRRSLIQEASAVRPSDRLDTILHEARTAGPVTATGGAGVRRWLVPAAAAAVVAAIAGGVWLSNEDPTVTPGPPAGNPSVTVPAPSGTASTPSGPASASTPPTTATSSAPPASATVSLPVYFVGATGGDKAGYGLYREFVRRQVGGNGPAARAKAALVLAVAPSSSSADGPYLQPWAGQTIGDVQVTDRAITIDLATSGDPAAATANGGARLAVQELVWTAQAAVQRGNLPVRFTVNGGDATLFGSIATAGRTFNRPSADRLYEDLAPIWVTAPSRDQVLPADKPVAVTGQAIVFEATVAWELTRGGTQVKEGHTMASIGAPQQGTYSIPLGTLQPGSYVVKVYAASPKDGSVTAQDSVTFTVK
ncbi:Gmad2 immunoglobulin-like domain-containing protein [Pedococcus sp. KACC 23699]|uniref:Gmad2 immunoglobulin-like domain-containing protein n=1 Tax=Pedococcus sp. KACC 23699 TaxID=3149228 RepID=A0AAU7JTY1_9MICO